MRTRAALLVLTAILGASPLSRADEPDAIPPIFTAAPLSDAIDASKQAGTIVIVDFTAEWCAPCKMMERTVWRDPRVDQWFKDRRAVAIRVDTDKNAPLRSEYAISAWPTLIGFKNGTLIDRRLGSMTTDQFLTWLNTIDRGGAPVPGTETIVKPAPTSTAQGLAFSDRLNAARAARDAGKLDKAQADLLALWSETISRDAEKTAAERMLLADELKSLASRHEPARTATTAERDRLETLLKSDHRTFEALDGWLRLNESLSDGSRTLAWYDRIKDDPTSRPTLDRTVGLLRPALERANRWADVVCLVRDPIRVVTATYTLMDRAATPKYLDESTRAAMRERHLNNFRAEAAGMYAGLLALDRDQDAADFAVAVIKLSDTPMTRVMLVEKAVQIGQPRKAQGLLLDQIEQAGGNTGELRKKAAGAPK